ncbi:hypothetical protein [Brucella cytisi]|uniref:hypothetical protein n=1 Tax=Brucella cytisi TaxID=407152 RepID=UPI0011609284|nr:hypothetical protein [Brucella cytisi]
MPLLFAILFQPSPASANTIPPKLAADRAAVMGRCAEAVNTDCLVESIQTYLVSGQDQFRRERVMQALASTQLFDGDVDQAMASYRQLSAVSGKAEFLISYAGTLILKGDKDDALKSLREADALLTDKQNPVSRLDMTSQSMSIAKAFADAGSPDEGRAILAEIAEYRHRIPMNPMLLALMVQVAKSQAAIGFRDDAALYLRQAFDKALDQEVSLTPEQIFQVFEAWSQIDPKAAATAAKDLVDALAVQGPSAFEFAIWTGLSVGLSSSDERATADKNARRSMKDAPERAFVLQLVPKLALVLKKNGKVGEAVAMLDDAAAEASALTTPLEKAQTLLVLAEALTGAGESAKSEKLLNDILGLGDEPGMQGAMLKHYVSAVPAQFALLGKPDIAYDLAIKVDEGRRDMAIIMAADKLAVKGDYRQAMRFLAQLHDEISPMMMAGIAQRLAGLGNESTTP